MIYIKQHRPLSFKTVYLSLIVAVEGLFYGYPKKILQTMEVNFAMRNSNYFARKIKSSCLMECQELQPHKVLWKEATEHGKKI